MDRAGNCRLLIAYEGWANQRILALGRRLDRARREDANHEDLDAPTSSPATSDRVISMTADAF